MTLLKLKQAPGSQAFPALNDIFDLFDNSIHAGFRSWNTPAVNILSTKDGYELQVAAPGMKKEDFRVSVDGDQLTVSAERKEEKQTDEKFTHREFRFTTFNRKFTLPENINVEQINASYENGVLHLVLPLMETQKAKTKEITIA
jgi:HSP20 family protein